MINYNTVIHIPHLCGHGCDDDDDDYYDDDDDDDDNDDGKSLRYCFITTFTLITTVR